MKIKARSRITDNIVSETEQEAPYQDDELVGLQEVLEVDPYVINESLADVDGGGEEIDTDLLKQLGLVELDEDECISSENDIEVNMKEKISDLFWCRKHFYMADRGRGGGRRTFNRGRRHGLTLGASITTNPSTSFIHISTSKSMIHVVAPTPNTLPTTQDQPNPTFVKKSIPTTPVRDASSSTQDDSLTLEFQPTYGCSNIISNIIRAKFDEPAASWLKVLVDLRDRWFREFKKEYRWHPQEERAIRAGFETKGSRILKSAMNKIINGQDKGKRITTNVRAALDKHWGSTDFLNKSSTTKVNRSVDRGASAYCGGSISTAAHFEKLSKEFQRPPIAWEVIEKTKKLKSGE
ncbi:hypothetical protein GmHk_15G044223 [Glycine max]|nr:hypothetical protein GmHk_15G044223 [Glycine max]